MGAVRAQPALHPFFGIIPLTQGFGLFYSILRRFAERLGSAETCEGRGQAGFRDIIDGIPWQEDRRCGLVYSEQAA
jgi:hypothetical protein